MINADKAVDLGLYEEKKLKNGKIKYVKANGLLEQKLIITFSRKTLEYQRTVRRRQIERAKRLLEKNDPEEIKKGPNDVKRFLKRTAKTKSGEEAAINYVLDEEKIAEEEKYDGYYAVATNLDDPAKEIIRINSQRYKIEDCFRVLKTNFSARPVFHQKRERIIAEKETCMLRIMHQ